LTGQDLPHPGHSITEKSDGIKFSLYVAYTRRKFYACKQAPLTGLLSYAVRSYFFMYEVRGKPISVVNNY